MIKCLSSQINKIKEFVTYKPYRCVVNFGVLLIAISCIISFYSIVTLLLTLGIYLILASIIFSVQ